MAFYQLFREQKVNRSIEEIWEFISSPKNLKQITPKHMGFNIVSGNLPEKMYPGMIIAYAVSPLFGIKTTWVSEITHVREKEFFVDEQRIGPYTLWHHQHILEPAESGVVMKDIVTYKPPFGFLGKIANRFIIKRKLDAIFDYRKNMIEKLFNS